MDQDPMLNNLIDPPDYAVGEIGTLGEVDRVGHGPQAMILIAGLGFGGEIFDSFMADRDEVFAKYVVTLPGFGGTPAPPAPPEGESFGNQTWTRGALTGIERLMEKEGLDDVVVVGHWLTGTQLALRLALDHPDRVRAVVLLSGSARFVAPEPDPARPDDQPLERRVAVVDRYLAPQWFRTVTRETWDDNNFLPGDYSVDPVLGLRLWREAASPPLHVWVRYLNEFYAQDVTLALDSLSVPTLLLKPGLEGLYHDPGNNYLKAYTDRGWGRWADGSGNFMVQTVPDSRIVPWVDHPELVDAAVADFLGQGATTSSEDQAQAVWAFRDVRAFDGDSAHPRTTVVVRGGRIEAMGPDLAIPTGARIVEGKGRTVLPGLIDSHTHTLTLQMLERALRFGVTTELDQFTLPAMLEAAKTDQREGEAHDRADLFSSGILATAAGGHGTEYGVPIPTVDDAVTAEKFVRERVEEGSDWIKIVWDDGATHGTSMPTLDSARVAALIGAAHGSGLKAVVHIAAVEAAIAALAMGADGLVHTVQESALPADFGARIAAAGGFVAPTLTVIHHVSGEPQGGAQLNDPDLQRFVSDVDRMSLAQSVSPRPGAQSSGTIAMESVRSMHAAGVPILAGTDAPNPGTAHGVTMHRELELLVEAGLTPIEALTAATSAPARAFGLEDRGRLAPGLRADLLLVDGDPTERIQDTRKIVGVWKAGVRVSSTP